MYALQYSLGDTPAAGGGAFAYLLAPLSTLLLSIAAIIAIISVIRIVRNIVNGVEDAVMGVGNLFLGLLLCIFSYAFLKIMFQI